jgi:ribonuclease Y
MAWVLYIGLAVLFVLVAVLFVVVLRSREANSRRTPTRTRASAARHQSGGAAAAGHDHDRRSTRSDVAADPLTTDEPAHDGQAYRDQARRLADDEAATTRQLAEREAEALRRAAEAEAVSVLRAARAEAALAREAAEAAAEEARRATQELERSLRIERVAAADAAADERRELNRRAAEIDQIASQVRADRAEADRAAHLADSAQAELVQREREVDQLISQLDERQAELDERAQVQVRELERVAGLSSDEAKTELMRAVEESSRREAAVLARSIETEARSTALQTARGIVVEAVQRCASEQTTETVVSVMHLPSDDMKGRIIGREGRNIRAFEAVTGVNVIIDDTPEAVLLSCFDPTRREVGRLTLEKLVADGRIHPHRIEEAHEQSKAEVDALCLRAANDALADVGIHDLDEHLIPTLGRLRYRTSYGQNVLGHLVETAHIAGVMAAELGLDPVLIKRCAFLHDIGKALTHEVQGSHAIIGAELLRKYGESEAVAHAVEAHHNEVQPRTLEAVLTQAADACSAARPGARRETLESYVKRLQRIEEIASARPGVEKVFAMQAGREVRVMVQPDAVDDLEAGVIAREIAKQIEDELTYPGQIRVTVVRESRATEVAH